MNHRYLELVGLLVLAVAIRMAGTSAVAAAGPRVSARVPVAMSLTISPSATLNAEFGDQIISPVTLTVKSNSNWSLSVYRETDLAGNSPLVVVTDAIPTGEAGATMVIDCKLTVDDDDRPGDDSATHYFVLAAP